MFHAIRKLGHEVREAVQNAANQPYPQQGGQYGQYGQGYYPQQVPGQPAGATATGGPAYGPSAPTTYGPTTGLQHSSTWPGPTPMNAWQAGPSPYNSPALSYQHQPQQQAFPSPPPQQHGMYAPQPTNPSYATQSNSPTPASAFAPTPTTYPSTYFSQPMAASQPAFSWGTLINPDKSPSPLFVRLLDAIFNFADATLGPSRTGALEPAKLGSLYEILMYAASNNHPRCFLQLATENHFPNPQATQNEAMGMVWRAFQVPYTNTQAGVPALTKEGFRATIVMDTLVDPVVQLKRLNYFLNSYGARLADPETGRPFPSATIPPEALPPVGDQEVQARQQRCMATVNLEFSKYQESLRQTQIFKHNMTMDAMTAGYFVPNTSGGYSYHHTGGLQW